MTCEELPIKQIILAALGLFVLQFEGCRCADFRGATTSVARRFPGIPGIGGNMSDPKNKQSSAQIGKANADGLKGQRYTVAGQQSVPPERVVTADQQSGRPGTHFSDVSKTGHPLVDQKDRPAPLPHEGKDRKLPC